MNNAFDEMAEMDSNAQYAIGFQMNDDFILYYTDIPGRYAFMEEKSSAYFGYTFRQAMFTANKMISDGDIMNFEKVLIVKKDN